MSFRRARQFLAERATQVGQKTLDRDRQAIQSLLRHTGKLAPNEMLLHTEQLSPPTAKNELSRVIKSARPQVLETRAYSAEQFYAIKGRMAAHNSLGSEIAQAAGLRAHELFTIARRSELTPDVRDADSAKFIGLENRTIYVVVGKGGLKREVLIPNELAERLERTRLEEPRQRRDRGIIYEQRYAVGGGQALSQAFSDASRAALGYSTGLHGVRHSYAQQREFEIQLLLGDPERARLIVSQEIGHFRPEITDVYMR